MSKRGQVRYGFIGAGGIARAHASAIQATGDKIAGVMDVNKEMAESFANDYSVDFVTRSVNSLVNRDDIDAIIVCTPNAFHAQQTIEALNAGKHVLCEKPMSVNVAQAKKMIQVAKKSGKIFTVGYVRRFMPTSEAVKSKIDKGELGNIYYAESKWLRRRGVPGYGGWFTTKKLSGGGPLIDLGCHMIDLVNWFIGNPKPKRVFATSGCHIADKDYVYLSMWGNENPKGVYDVEDYASAMIRYDNGVTVLLQVSWAINIADDNKLETWIAGDKAGCVTNGNEVVFAGQEQPNALTELNYRVKEANCFERQIAHFSDCIKNGKKPRVKPEEALMVQQILQAIYDSSKQKKEIVIR